MALNSFKRSTLQLSVLLGCAVGTQVNAEETSSSTVPRRQRLKPVLHWKLVQSVWPVTDTLFKIPGH